MILASSANTQQISTVSLCRESGCGSLLWPKQCVCVFTHRIVGLSEACLSPADESSLWGHRSTLALGDCSQMLPSSAYRHRLCWSLCDTIFARKPFLVWDQSNLFCASQCILGPGLLLSNYFWNVGILNHRLHNILCRKVLHSSEGNRHLFAARALV